MKWSLQTFHCCFVQLGFSWRSLAQKRQAEPPVEPTAWAFPLAVVCPNFGFIRIKLGFLVFVPPRLTLDVRPWIVSRGAFVDTEFLALLVGDFVRHSPRRNIASQLLGASPERHRERGFLLALVILSRFTHDEFCALRENPAGDHLRAVR